MCKTEGKKRKEEKKLNTVQFEFESLLVLSLPLAGSVHAVVVDRGRYVSVDGGVVVGG
jgi:hypothetical protein